MFWRIEEAKTFLSSKQGTKGKEGSVWILIFLALKRAFKKSVFYCIKCCACSFIEGLFRKNAAAPCQTLGGVCLSTSNFNQQATPFTSRNQNTAICQQPKKKMCKAAVAIISFNLKKQKIELKQKRKEGRLELTRSQSILLALAELAVSLCVHESS